MLETYTIDPALLGNIKKKMLIRVGVLMFILIVIIYAPDVLNKKKLDVKSYGIAFCITVAVLIFTINKASTRVTNSLMTRKIVLSDEGIESKAELQPNKKIEWNNLLVEEKLNGTIDLYDRNVSKFNRKMYGKGWIRVIPEIMDKDKLLDTVRLKAPYAFQ